MEAGLKQFIEAYAKDKNLTEVEVGMIMGAVAHEAIAKLPDYAKLVETMNAVAPWLLHYIQLAGKSPFGAQEGESNDNSQGS